MSTVRNVRSSLWGGNLWPGLLAGLLLHSFLAGPAAGATAANFVIPAGTASYTFNGTTQGVQPGQVIELATGVHGPRTFRNIVGTVSQPVIIRSAAGGQAVIRRVNPASGGFVFEIRASHHFVIDGSNISAGTSGHPYGIKITYASNATAENKDAPSVFLKTSGDTVTPQVFNNCSNFAIRFVEVDGGWPMYSSDGIGIHTNHAMFSAIDYPTSWQENITIEYSRILNIEGEGMYIGASFADGGIPLRNVVVDYNQVSNTGWEGIQLKSPVSGTNLVHHNVLRQVGRRSDDKSHGQLSGISVLDGNGRIYNNWVEKVGDSGIKHFIDGVPTSYGDQVIEVFNNVIVDTGEVAILPSHGIVSESNVNKVHASPLPRIYNNTVIRALDSGISVGSQAAGGFVRDNIVAEAGSRPVNTPPATAQINNRAGSLVDMGFINPSALDFHLSEKSTARDVGSDQFPGFDFDDVPRPISGRSDQGAFEATGAVPPAPPTVIVVE